MEKESFYSRYACCIVVMGYSRSAIVDIQNRSFVLIPNEAASAINKKFFNILELRTNYEHLAYFLEQNKFIFPVPHQHIECFPDLDISYQSAFPIEHAIVDCDNIEIDDIKNIIGQVDNLNCRAVQFRFFGALQQYDMSELLNITIRSSIESVEIKSNYKQWMCKNSINRLVDECSKLSSFAVTGAEKEYTYTHKQCTINMFNKGVLALKDCGNINPNNFCASMQGVLLSNSYNSCLYKKISIDSEGNIRNCPSCSQSFGNIRDTTLEQALNHPDFKRYWNITKDQIVVCRDCEFRYICMDCRVFIKDPENMYSQPAKCPYNPYIARWQGEEGYVPVEECGTYTREAGFTPNPRRIAALNQPIWGE